MLKNDWNDFVSEVTWLIKPNDKVLVSETANNKLFCPSDEFKFLFSNLTNLLMSARITKIEINDEKFELLGWTDANNESFGWLCKSLIISRQLFCARNINYY